MESNNKKKILLSIIISTGLLSGVIKISYNQETLSLFEIGVIIGSVVFPLILAMPTTLISLAYLKIKRKEFDFIILWFSQAVVLAFLWGHIVIHLSLR